MPMLAPGTNRTPPQFRHFAFLPAKLSGATAVAEHAGQLTLIDMSKTPVMRNAFRDRRETRIQYTSKPRKLDGITPNSVAQMRVDEMSPSCNLVSKHGEYGEWAADAGSFTNGRPARCEPTFPHPVARILHPARNTPRWNFSAFPVAPRALLRGKCSRRATWGVG
jgi:hypothetical protein